MNDFHSFIGIPVSDELSEHFKIYQTELQLGKYYKKLVYPQDFHLTCLFLGGLHAEKRVKLWEELVNHVAEERNFSLRFNRINVFGNPAKPRVVYAEPDRESQLENLQKLISLKAEACGINVDKRPFRPHVTLAKKWAGGHSVKENTFRKEISPLSFKADRVCLYKITPGEEPMYHIIDYIRLGTG